MGCAGFNIGNGTLNVLRGFHKSFCGRGYLLRGMSQSIACCGNIRDQILHTADHAIHAFRQQFEFILCFHIELVSQIAIGNFLQLMKDQVNIFVDMPGYKAAKQGGDQNGNDHDKDSKRLDVGYLCDDRGSWDQCADHGIVERQERVEEQVGLSLPFHIFFTGFFF